METVLMRTVGRRGIHPHAQTWREHFNAGRQTHILIACSHPLVLVTGCDGLAHPAADLEHQNAATDPLIFASRIPDRLPHPSCPHHANAHPS